MGLHLRFRDCQHHILVVEAEVVGLVMAQWPVVLVVVDVVVAQPVAQLFPEKTTPAVAVAEWAVAVVPTILQLQVDPAS